MKIKTPDNIGENDKTIGIIGVAPWSAIEFIKILYEQVEVTKDWHYPRVICDINTKIPSRGRHFDLGEEDFSEYIKENINSLKKQGAEVIAIICNTAHIYFDKWGGKDDKKSSTKVKVLNIIEESINEVKNSNAKKISFLSGLSLYNLGLYQEKIKDIGLQLYELNEQEANLIYKTILAIKNNALVDEDISKVEELFIKLKLNNVDTLLLGCTELSFIYELAKKHFKNVIDSNVALAKSVIKNSKEGK